MSTVLDTEQTRSQIFNQLNQLVSYVQDFIQTSSDLSKLLALSDNSFIVPSEPASISGSWMMSLDETLKLAVDQREEIQASLAAARSMVRYFINAILFTRCSVNRQWKP